MSFKWKCFCGAIGLANFGQPRAADEMFRCVNGHYTRATCFFYSYNLDLWVFDELLNMPPSLNTPPSQGIKQGNPKDVISETRVPLWLLSTQAKIAWAVAQFAGLSKYGAWNWRADGARFSTYLSAIERHVEGLKNGEEFDPVDGTRHEGNIMACCAILIDARAAGKLVDDRPPRIDHRPALEEAEQTLAALKEKYKDKHPKHWTISDVLP